MNTYFQFDSLTRGTVMKTTVSMRTVLDKNELYA